MPLWRCWIAYVTRRTVVDAERVGHTTIAVVWSASRLPNRAQMSTRSVTWPSGVPAWSAECRSRRVVTFQPEAQEIVVTREAAATDVEAFVNARVAVAVPYVDADVGALSAVMTNAPASIGPTVMGSVIADAQLAATSSAATGGARIAVANTDGTLAIGDQTNAPNVDGDMEIRSVTKLCVP
jgi:hypothetical protein